MKNIPISFMFVGRLVKEKGIDLLIKEIDQLVATGYDTKIEINIFGDGPLREQIVQQAKRHSFVHYYGFTPQDELKEHRKNTHYTLMPSRFLETFGLSALESLAAGVPVVGYRKGGLEQFILPEHDLSGRRLHECIIELTDGFTQEAWEQKSNQAKETYSKFSKEQRLQNFERLADLKPGSKILLVSDYATPVGGIETIILDMQKTLIEAGYTVEILGKQTDRTEFGKRVDLAKSSYNIAFNKQLTEKIATFSPDLIWRHSVLRYIGRYPLSRIGKLPCKQRVMYHDFGLFHPYPSKVYTLGQLERAQTMAGYLKEGTKGGLLQQLLLVQKRYVSKRIRTLLEQDVDLHLVPSPYMEELLDDYFPESEITKLSHFSR